MAVIHKMRSLALYLLVGMVLLLTPTNAEALDFYRYLELGITPIPCSGNDTIACPNTANEKYDSVSGTTSGFQTFYDDYNTNIVNGSKITNPMGSRAQECATAYAPNPSPTPPGANSRPFTSNPKDFHFWAEDQDITALGKSAERARQFVSWVMSRSAVDQAISLRTVWGVSRNLAVSLMIIVTAVFGLAIILAKRMNTGYKFSAQNSALKIGLSMLFIALSASIMFSLVAFSEIIMKFFIETLGGKDVFNTFFGSAQSNEWSYAGFVGCRDLNIRVKEAADAQTLLIQLRTVTYYIMGSMLILRKILLWFLLFVSPFLPILLSFPLIRNTGRIWIGVFFQWLFYGPLFALFFGATSRLFNDGIPFAFDFSRVDQAIGYVFPTAIFITYGGPAQRLNGINNGNYIDTFAESVITLLLWWAVTWFPWWLLRIYRDYCCDGIYAMRNAIYGMIDKLGQKPPALHPDIPPPNNPSPKNPTDSPRFELKMPKTATSGVIQSLRLENPNVIRQAKTESIVTAMSLRATTLKDIVRLETNKSAVQTVKSNLALLENPLSANTTTDRQTYLNIRTELFTRASTRNDVFAQRILSTTNRASQSYINKRNELTKSVETIVSSISEKNVVNLTKSVSDNVKRDESSVSQTTNSVVNNITNNLSALQAISSGAKVETTTVKQILQSYAQNIDKPFTTVVSKISETTQVSKEKVKDVLRETQTLIHRAQSVGRLAQTIVPDKAHAAELLAQVDKLVTGVSERASAVGSQMVVRISQLILNIIQSNPGVMALIEQKTHSSSEAIKSTLEAVSKSQTMNAEALRDIANKAGMSKESLQDIVVEAAKIVQSQSLMSVDDLAPIGDTPLDAVVRSTLASGVKMEASQPIVSILSNELRKVFADDKVSSVTKEILKHTIQDEQIVSTIQIATGLSRKQVQQTLEALSQSPSITDEATLANLAETAGVEKSKALQVVREAVKQANAAKSVTSIGGEDADSDVEVTRMLEDQLEIALNPESQIDQAIPLDPSQLEDYDEIRKLWVDQYKTGEVPLSENVHSRLEWVVQDLDVITNIIRKLISKDENMRQQALDEIGFILPIFLMNNLSANQLITYLKAKASAAREVKVDIEKLAVEEDERTFADVNLQTGPVEDNTKHLEVDEESGESKTAKEPS